MHRRIRRPRYHWTVGKLVIWLLLVFFAFLFIMPVLFMVMTSFKDKGQIWAYPIVWIPRPFIVQNYVDALNQIPYFRAIFNSFVIAAATVVCQSIVASMAAYAFTFINFRGKNIVFLIILATMMIPGYVLLIPLYLIVDKLRLMDTYFAMIAPYMISAFSIYLLKSFYSSIPKGLDEAARIDGCSRIQILFRIILPLSGSALLSMGIFVFMNQWNSFLWPLLVTAKDDVRPITIYLSYFTIGNKTEYGPLMAAATLASAPMLIIFVFAQRHFIEGLAMTGMKQ